MLPNCDYRNANQEDELLCQATFCRHCGMWLNGAIQVEDHRIGKKHKKKVKREPRMQVVIKKAWNEFKAKTDWHKSKRIVCLHREEWDEDELPRGTGSPAASTTSDAMYESLMVMNLLGHHLATVFLNVDESSEAFYDRVSVAVGHQEFTSDGVEVLLSIVLPCGNVLASNPWTSMGSMFLPVRNPWKVD